MDSNHKFIAKQWLGATHEVGQIDVTGRNSTGHDWMAAECQQIDSAETRRCTKLNHIPLEASPSSFDHQPQYSNKSP